MINLPEFTRTLFCCMIPGCDKAYSTRFNLKRHVESIHQKKKKHQCSECMRWFASKQNLVEHIYTHTGDRPFECIVCGQAFRQASQLSLHRRKHDLQKEEQILDKIPQKLSALRLRENNRKVRKLDEILELDYGEEYFDISLPPLRKNSKRSIDEV